ncbi:MAG: putative poly(beta-D-mannuronate) O-acetylase [Labilithrix sp.]|nr:putative poly(beta-D-mannuronate) O-acetylase [Labilithrix sp.]
MGFTGYAFALFFFGLVLPLRYLLPLRFTRGVLLAASVAFYLTWGWKLAVLLGALTLFTYGAGVLLRTRETGRKAIVTGAIVVLLGTLATFKYVAFFASFVPGLHVTQLPLPLGISFYVFEMVSYVVDVYRGDPGAKTLPEFALYVSYFPHLIAGPIVRASELLPQLRDPQPFDGNRAIAGMFVMLTGFVKKMVLADNLGGYADAVFKAPATFNSVELAFGVLAYTGQIFCDFSGYTDIARGGSTLLGFELPENFDYPYLSRSITEFWRRWHMTLSRWLRDYLYISLGGNRGGRFATYRNLFLTMTLGGLWHGARITFVIWGAYHGVLLALHKLHLERTRSSAAWQSLRAGLGYQIFATACTLVLVMIGWVFFRAVTFHDAIAVLGRIPRAWPAAGWRAPKVLQVTELYLAAVVLLHVAGAVRLGQRTNDLLPAAARGVFWASIGVVLYAFASTSPTFIYFYF